MRFSGYLITINLRLIYPLDVSKGPIDQGSGADRPLVPGSYQFSPRIDPELGRVDTG